jgi:hypothetical protein
MGSAALLVAAGGLGGFALAARRWDLRAAFDLAPAILASAILSYLFAGLIWPVLPIVWQAGAYHEAIGGFVASLLPGLVGGLVDPDAPRYKQAQQTAFLGCAFVGFCFIGWPILVGVVGVR